MSHDLQPSQRSLKEKLFKTVAGVVGAAALAACGTSVEAKDSGTSNEQTSTANSVSSETGQLDTKEIKFTQPDVIKLDPNTLAGMDEQEWDNTVNETLMVRLDWYLDQCIEHNDDMSVIPTDLFTDNAESEIVRTIQEMASEIVAATPSVNGKKTEVSAVLGPIASEQIIGDPNTDANNLSTLVSRGNDYPGISNLGASVQYSFIDANGYTDGPKEYTTKLLSDDYIVAQVGNEVHIN